MSKGIVINVFHVYNLSLGQCLMDFIPWMLLQPLAKILVSITQENVSLTTSFNDQKLLVTIVTNLDTYKKNLLVTKIVIIMNTKL